MLTVPSASAAPANSVGEREAPPLPRFVFDVHVSLLAIEGQGLWHVLHPWFRTERCSLSEI